MAGTGFDFCPCGPESCLQLLAAGSRQPQPGNENWSVTCCIADGKVSIHDSGIQLLRYIVSMSIKLVRRIDAHSDITFMGSRGFTNKQEQSEMLLRPELPIFIRFSLGARY